MLPSWKAFKAHNILRILTRFQSTKIPDAVIGIDLGTTNSAVAIMAVSYTHLDVYKRQHLHHSK